ncbi:hypothetical protein JXA56_01225 [Candidatus Micrarchaeota archaeon]|nr:hypothetical protein [Candidatus Micrarchaeota archaeon]
MTAIRSLFGMFLFMVLVGSVFAQLGLGGQSFEKESVVYYETDATRQVLTISVVAFEPAQSQDGTQLTDTIKQELLAECRAEGADNIMVCLQRKALERTAASTDYRLDMESLQEGTITVYQWNAISKTYVVVPTCTQIPINNVRTVTDSSGEAVDNYYTTCDLSGELEGATSASFVIEYEPQEGSGIAPSTTTYSYDSARVAGTDALTQQINQVISAISSGGANGTPALPCVGIFLILGLLLSSLYFAGKSPVSLLDITTPRLPAPKGVAAGGQMLMPFGYAEMGRTTKAKMRTAAVAAGVTAAGLATKSRGDVERRQLESQVDATAAKASRAHVVSGDVGEQANIQKALIAGGREAGMSRAELDKLSRRLLYDYGDSEHRTVAQILEKLKAKGGKNALMAMTLQDYIIGQRQLKTLEAITTHPDIGKRDYVSGKISSVTSKAFGVNRYAIIGGFVPAMVGSTTRTARQMVRMSKASVKQAPNLVKATARSTIELVGGKRAVEELEYKAKTSQTAGWFAGQLKENPASVIVGQSFPVSDKAGYFYKQLRDEAHHDSMRYLLRQIYKKMGVKFNVSEEEMAQMGHVDMDILKRSGYKPTKEMLAMEAELRGILGDKSKSFLEKVNALTAFAERCGAHVDHNAIAFTQKVESIHMSVETDHGKMLLLQEELERQSRVRGSNVHDDAFVCHIGGDTLRGPAIWETMVLRTMIYDAENGHLQGGIREELLSARLNTANRLATLDPSHAGAMEQLPEHMRNQAQLTAVAERNRSELVQLFSEEGKAAFQKSHKDGKSMESASLHEIVAFMYGGGVKEKATGHVDPKTGKMMWWGADQEHTVPKDYALVDVKRHWVDHVSVQDNYAIGQWVESRFTRSYVPAARASIEAELDRMPGSAAWTVEERAKQAKKLWIRDEMIKDFEQRFNSQFANNAYGGTTRETARFYNGIAMGFLAKALEEKGLSSNHPDAMFLQGIDHTNPQHIGKMRELLLLHRDAYEKVAHRDVTYNDVAKSSKPMVMLHEGGFAYYHKGMMLSDADRVMGGQVSIRDNNGQMRAFVPDDVVVKFGARDDLTAQFYKARGSKDPNEWHGFLDAATKWTKEGNYSYEKEKVLAAVLWEYSNRTYDYERFWSKSAVTVESKREVAPVAPSFLRFFGADGHKYDTMIKPFRDIGLHAGDYVSKVALEAGGPVHTASYEITPTSEYYRQHSWKLAERIMSGQDVAQLSDAEKVAYRNYALSQGAYHQVWDYSIDRNPWRTSTSFGAAQSWASFFHFGPAQNFNVRDNLRAYMGKGEYTGFMATHGFALDLAGKMMRPYLGAIRGMQMSMQGYASKWDSQDNALRQWNYTQPRLREALQSLNPFSYRWFPGKTSENIAKLNVFGGSLEQHQLAGPEYMAGLKQAPQDIFLQRKGVYASARTGEANPAASFYNYRHELMYDAPMAEYMIRQKDASFMYDKKVQDAAMNNTQRRTVSAEALAIRREEELRGFGIMQNPLYGWANPIAFLWHAPLPMMPSSLTPKDIVANAVRKHKYGQGGSWNDTMNQLGQNISKGTKDILSPHMLHRTVYCPSCGRSGYRGARCGCGKPLY